jgi:hypothetical protein
MNSTCPVCGKGEYVDQHTWCRVSHLACVAALKGRDENYHKALVKRKQEAALYGDKAEWEGLSVALSLWTARAEEGGTGAKDPC